MSGTRNPSVGQGLYAQIKDLLDRNELMTALEAAETALSEGREPQVAVYGLSAACYRRGMIGNAIQLVRDLADSGDFLPDTHEILAVLYCRAGLLSQGLYHSKEASLHKPDGMMIALYGPDLPKFSDALVNVIQKPLMRLGLAALARWDVASAIVQFEQHLLIDPNDVEVIDHYARALMLDGQNHKALGMLRSLVTLGGLKPTLLSRIGACLISMGRHEQGLANHRTALAGAPNSIALWGTLVADLAYLPADRSDAAALTQDWATCVETNAVKSPRPAPALADGDSVTLAFLCSSALLPTEREMLQVLVAGLDKKRFKTLGLGNGDLTESQNVPFRGLFDRWRNVAELDVLTLGALIRGEGVAVLIDADGLRLPARAGLFLRNCAPVQAAWLNAPVHGATPGATAHLVAAAGELPGEVVIPGGRYLMDVAPFAVGTPPSAQDGMPFTFGADVTMAEMTPDTVALWAQVLMAVPNSLLLLRDSGQFGEQESISAIIDLFGNFGVAHRVDVTQADLSVFCAQVDVVLAPKPHFNALDHGRMVLSGIPVVVLADGPVAGDLAAALHGARDHGNMVASDAVGYVECARFWAQSPERLAAFRADPRAALAGTVAFDRNAYCRAFGEALQGRIAQMLKQAESA